MFKNFIKFFIFALLYTLSSYGFEYSAKCLLEERQIPDECLQQLVQKDFADGEIFDIKDWRSNRDEKNANCLGFLSKWEYIGSIGEYHIIRSEIDGDTWRMYSISVLTFLENGIIKTAEINGLKKHEVISAEIRDDRIVYSQMKTGACFFDAVSKLFPKLHALLPEICGELKLFIYEPIGFFTFENQLDAQGKISSEKIVSFTPCEGWAPYSGKEYKAQELENLLLQLCK